MRVFADFHHGDLFYSFYRLFELRFGAKIYRPIGLDWFYERFWKIADPYPEPLDTAMQYLDFSPEAIKNQALRDRFLNRPIAQPLDEVDDDVHYLWQISQEFFHRGITLEKFKSMKFDIVISSIPEHEAPYTRLVEQYQPSALHIGHIGNQTWTRSSAPVVLVSVDPRLIHPSPGQKIVFCRQEFDKALFERPPSIPEKPRITSICHYLPHPDLLEKFERALPEFEFKMYGAGCRDGELSSKKLMAEEMAKSTFGWMIRTKGFGDGFGGHTFTNWIASGKPMIVRSSDNVGLPGNTVLTSGLNCIDISEGTFEQQVAAIRTCAKEEKYLSMCKEMRKVSDRELNFDAQAANVMHVLRDCGVRFQ